MYRRILVPLDGTRFGEHGLPWAVGIAARTGAAIELVHVHHHSELDPDLAALPQYRLQRLEAADSLHDRDAAVSEQHYLEAVAADIELRYAVRVGVRLLTGATSEAVAREAGEIVADLVVMATHARSGMPRLRHGDLAHDLITQLNVPVLCVRPRDADAPLAAAAPRRILVALDGSEFSEQILDAVAPLAGGLDAAITLLHVVTPRPMLATGFEDLPRAIPHRAEALAYLEALRERTPRRAGVADVIALEATDPAAVIANVAASGGYDVIALATHGRSGLSRLILGSIAEQVVRTSSTPVLLYRPRLARLPAGDLAELFRV